MERALLSSLECMRSQHSIFTFPATVTSKVLVLGCRNFTSACWDRQPAFGTLWPFENGTPSTLSSSACPNLPNALQEHMCLREA